MNLRNSNYSNKLIILLIIVFSIILRTIWLDRFTPSLYSDEVSLAYNAYSIMKTGRDEHGSIFPIALRAFGDWKPALEAYLIIPSFFIFGVNDFSARFPSAVLGILTILLTYLIVLEINMDYKKKQKLALSTAFLLSISPWHLHQSRSTILMMTGLFFLLVGIYSFLRGLKNAKYLSVSFASFALCLYSYHSLRFIVPVLGLFILIKYYKYFLNVKKWFFLGFLIGCIVLLPLVISFINEPNIILGRAKPISIFSDKGITARIWEFYAQDGIVGEENKIAHLFHNKYYIYFLEIIRRFTDHFEPQFLFVEGDNASPFNIPNMGILYFIDAFFLILGIYFILNNDKKARSMLFFMLIIFVFPAALTFQTPAQNRTFNAVIPYMFIISYGILFFIDYFPKKLFSRIIILTFYILNFGYYLQQYYLVLPKYYSWDWLYGLKQTAVIAADPKYKEVVIMPKVGMFYIYLLYYTLYDPLKFITEVKRDNRLDEFGFERVTQFGKYTFLREETWKDLSKKLRKDTLYIGRVDEIPDNSNIVTINYPDGKPAYRFLYIN